jgi:Fe-S oxidoreductase
MPTVNPFLSAAVITLGLLLLAWSLYRRYLPLNAARPAELPGTPWDRFKSLLQYVVLQRRMFRDKYAGLYHALIFYGFVVFGLKSLSLLLEGYGLDLGIQHFGPYQLSKDLFIVLVLAGIALAVARRLLFKPERLKNSFDAFATLFFIAGLMVTDGLSDGAVILLGDPAWKGWAPVSSAFASFISPDAAGAVYIKSWWLHLVLLLGFMNELPYSKHFHVYTSAFNVWFRPLGPSGKLPGMDLEKLDENSRLGVSAPQDFTWKQTLDLYTCTECGRCREFCPTRLTEKPLSPMEFGLACRDLVYANNGNLARAEVDLPQGGIPALIGETVKEDVIWSCTTCRYCEQACPLFISYVDKLVGMRQHLVMEKSEFPPEAALAFKGMEVNGNPWNMPRDTRTDWCEGLDVPLASEKQAEWLFWVGCAGSYDDHGKKMARMTVDLLRKAGLDFTILGPEESCTGDSARRMGNEYLFQMMAQANVEVLNSHGVKKIVTFCPHCFNTLAHEYPQFGGNYEVFHVTEVLAKSIAEGKLAFTQTQELELTYHDSCYLGRYNGVLDAPRFVLEHLPGVKVKEMALSKEKGMCCGAGGGRMWLEEKLGTRINHLRLDQAVATGTQGVALSCPFCYIMMENATKEKDWEAFQVHDVLELAHKALQ